MSVKIDPKVIDELKRMFTQLKDPITLYFFKTSIRECRYCSETEYIVDTISNLSPLINVIKYKEGELEVRKFNIEMYPAIVIHGREEYNIRFFGLPTGGEFGVLVNTIVAVSTGNIDLSESTIKDIKNIDKDVHIRVFVTPACPYCPRMAWKACMFALVNKRITTDIIEAAEFPDLIEKYNIFAVPKVVINDKVEFEGMVPERVFLKRLLKAIE
ncbi:MAG: glutaredoxin [Thermoprotei archaeon]|nr:MAG: glutaredoxin [Thermoprotei archaeon]RLE89644.1 MAG: glutaredoxin [Thermoprotei archaeon]